MKSEMLPVVILAGGLATRLRPLTQKIPKALIEVNGQPFIAHQLRLLKQKGIRRVIICSGYLGEMIQEFVGDGRQFGMSVDYSADGPTLLGTAGAIRKALPLLPDSFFVLYGDSYLTCNFAAVQDSFLKSGMTALMTVLRNEGQWDRSNVEYSDGRILVYEKKNTTPEMHHIDYGLGLFKRTAFENIPPDQPKDLALLYQEILKTGSLAAFEVHERFYEIGSLQGLEELKAYLNARRDDGGK